MLRYFGGAALLLAVFLGVSVWQSLAFPQAVQTLPDFSLTALSGSTESLETRDAPTVVYL